MALSISQARLGLADHKFNRWNAIQAAGETFEDCLNPSYWAHVAKTFRVGDEIRVINDEMTRRAILLVTEVANVWAKVAVIEYNDVVPASEEIGENYKVGVEWAGPHDKFRVIRSRGGQKEILSAKHETKDGAQKWAAEHLKTISQTPATKAA